MQRVAVFTLGCSKNLVDSERLLGAIKALGYEAVHEPRRLRRGDIVVVNTCGFIGDAKEESINAILRLARARRRGTVSRLHVMGCLSQRYARELPPEIPEVDRWWGKFDWPGIIKELSAATTAPAAPPLGGESGGGRMVTTPSHHAYLKIAEGCNRFCAFCAIPIITGRYTSLPIDEILSEARSLAAQGVKELNVIAQDISDYGHDLATPPAPPLKGGVSSPLAILVDRLADIPGIERIRLHYAYPTRFPMDVLDVMARRPNVCRYLDIALQHIADPVLKNMRRHITGDETRRLLDEIRRRVPGIHIRTTLMVGFPGEGDGEFAELMDFVRSQRFERMGAFAYCEEEGTYAARRFDDSIPPQVKQQRLDALMALQEQISLELQEQKVGQTLPVIIDREEEDYYIGRTEFDSPEVDPEVLVEKTRRLTVGSIVDVTVTRALPFELIASPAPTH